MFALRSRWALKLPTPWTQPTAVVSERGHAKVLDFGLTVQSPLLDIGALTEEQLTESGSAVGDHRLYVARTGAW
jgi:hypothetical protein